MLAKRTPSVSLLAAAVAGVSILAAACGGSSSTPSSPTPGSGTLVTVFITNGAFSPNPITMTAGQQVNFKNNDTIEHSATFDNGSYESGNIPALSAHDVPVTMSAKGSFAYHCRLHSAEKGSIVVQ
jgi:plastocyanin